MKTLFKGIQINTIEVKTNLVTIVKTTIFNLEI